ncbi:hypothetical protein LXL04_012139 [Taraxacum kok-saghyz]
MIQTVGARIPITIDPPLSQLPTPPSYQCASPPVPVLARQPFTTATEEAPTGLRETALHPAAKKLVGDITVDGEPGLLVRRVADGDRLCFLLFVEALGILKKGEWTVCSIHTSKKQKKSQQIQKKEEESIDSD